MKTKFYWVALLASAAMIAQAGAGGHHGGGGGPAGGFAPARSAPSRGGGAVSSFHPMPTGNFHGDRTVYSGRRFSSAGLRSPSSTTLRPHHVNSTASASVGSRQFARGNIRHADRSARFSNAGKHVIRNPGHGRNSARQVRNGNSTLRADWRNHVVAQHSANWHRDWDRGRDHWWHGHRCHFFNGAWFIFDVGFDPWWPYWSYPYDYYADDYYPDPDGYYGEDYQGEQYYGQDGYADQYSDSTVAAAQEQLAQEGYYRGEIDGVFGPETRRAILRYQSNHGLRVTGELTLDTLQALGLRRIASNE